MLRDISSWERGKSCGVGFGNDWALICFSWDGPNECRRRVDERKVGSSQS